MTTYEKSSTSREWTYTRKPFSSFPKAKDEYEGFCPILPVRLTGISDFDAIRSATRTYITKHRNNWSVKNTLAEMGIDDPSKMTDEQVEAFTKRQNWTFLRPNSDRYWNNVNEIRDYFMKVTGGFVQPMKGRIILDIDIVCPNAQDRADAERRAGKKIFFTKQDLDNCSKPILDACDFRALTNEGKDENGNWREGQKLGLVVDDQAIVELNGKKHDRREGEQTGFYWRLRRADGKAVETNASIANKEMTQKWVDDHQKLCALRNADEKRGHTERWENALSDGTFTARSRTSIRLALLTTDDSPLDPTIAQHYVALAKVFDRDTAATLVFEEQNQVNTRRALGKDAEIILCDVEKDVEELIDEEGIEMPEIAECMSVKQLDKYL